LDIRRGPVVHAYTVGWRPTCDHYPRTAEWLDVPSQERHESDADYALRGELLELWRDMESVPATVLDPFCGSGTVGEVCRETGRRFIGLDLSATYLRDLALPRAEGKQTRASMRALPLFAEDRRC
jgi:hypothetical protein